MQIPRFTASKSSKFAFVSDEKSIRQPITSFVRCYLKKVSHIERNRLTIRRAGAIIQILQYLSSAEQLKMFTLWSMGSLSHITVTQLGIMIPMLCIGLLISVACIKSLNLLLLGENYARTMGMNIKRSRTFIFVSTALLTGTVTAFCGPVGFIGLAVPHVTRLLFNNADHRILVPGTMLTGLISMLLCDIIAKKFLLPVNCITALLGVPVILWVIAKNLRRFK